MTTLPVPLPRSPALALFVPLANALAVARGTLFPWVAVFLGVGIGLWFALPWEPGVRFYLGVSAGLMLTLWLRLRGPEGLHPPAVALACIAAGILACGVRVQMVAAPMLEFRYYGPVEGRIVGIDRSQSDALRLTLDRVVLLDVSPARVPERVRVTVQGDQPWLAPLPGQVVMTTAFLSAPEGPVEPGAFDFRRMAFFDRLGAVGYTRAPVLQLAPPADGDRRIDRLRSYLTAAIQNAVPGDAGAFAAGVMTGDRSGLSGDAVADLRDSSLAHLLAISGMNMAFLVAFVFGLLRSGLAVVPVLALRVNAKKVAAVAAFGVALFYLQLSGANVATERAFIMVTVMLGAVLLDRRALTLRSVAIAGAILLLAKPESLAEPGFQMSFAATVALIVGFRALDARVAREKLPRWLVPVYALVLSSVIGGLSTAPYAAAHFNRFTDYGLVANLLTVPVMGAVVMPAGAVAALLAPLGLAAPALWVMELGCRWILAVADWIAGLEGAVTAIVAPGPWVLPLLTLGAAWAVLWRGRSRWAGLVPVLAALVLWGGAGRPAVLVSGDGRLVGVLGPEGRALSAPRGGGFAARNWLENDGDLATQAEAARRPGLDGPAGARQFALAGVAGMALSGRGAAEALMAVCARGGFVVFSGTAEGDAGPCALLDAALLRRTGPVALDPGPDGRLRITAVRVGSRIWQAPAVEPGVLTELAARASRRDGS